ncbi:MAG: hypothetical protein ACLTSX_01060 [Collinsella sp.]
MANLIAIMGESGSGKTTSLRNLDPSTTYIFDADKKGPELARVEGAIQRGESQLRLDGR